jgi:hypothetical protein
MALRHTVFVVFLGGFFSAAAARASVLPAPGPYLWPSLSITAGFLSRPVKQPDPGMVADMVAPRVVQKNFRGREIKIRRTGIDWSTPGLQVTLLTWLYIKLITLFGIFLIGCATQSVFDDYVASFASEAKRHGTTFKQTRFEFGSPRTTPLSSHNLAECVPGNALNTARVVVDEAQWNKLSHSSREALVFHEMGHCALAEPHGPGLMMPTLIAERMYRSSKRYLVDKLFRNARPGHLPIGH